MTPQTPVQPWDQDHLTRGRDLTDDEIDHYLADRQTALRHATARVGDEIAEQLRDRLRDDAALSQPVPDLDPLREAVEHLLAAYTEACSQTGWSIERTTVAEVRTVLGRLPVEP